MSSAGRRRHRQRADGHASRRSVVAAIGDCLGLSLCPCFARHALAAGDQRTVRYGVDHIEVDLAAVRRGESLLVEAKTTPIIIRHRTRKEISAARQARSGDLKDPEADEDRVIRPEWLVVHGLCTHLHCPLLEGLGEIRWMALPLSWGRLRHVRPGEIGTRAEEPAGTVLRIHVGVRGTYKSIPVALISAAALTCPETRFGYWRMSNARQP